MTKFATLLAISNVLENISLNLIPQMTFVFILIHCPPSNSFYENFKQLLKQRLLFEILILIGMTIAINNNR